ncbi:MAG TPA: FeS-binding protein, partial [Syntrophomonas sp.]|nr:FeS-binding protein [Syntrophomonas sp.]
LDACIRCGRCQENCPAYYTGKKLNPKVTVIQAMKKHLDGKAPHLLSGAARPELAMTSDAEANAVSPLEASLLYDVVTPEVLWACTNCRACQEHCPMFIEHIPKIVEMRRNLVMWQGDM